ncbi:MAG: cell envelope integrity protein TolA, partial [Pseudohongiellaceae bacterium]
EAARQAESARQEAAQRQAEQSALEDQSIQSYTAIIHDAVSQNWSVPPSARNGMTVVLQIQLVPTGEVVAVNVLQSSGDAVFDRSAEQAVNKADRFPEIQNMPISLFEREFRTFNLVFRPEDLLR